MNLYLIRHGESTANVDRMVYQTTKDFDIPLTDKGERQATECGISFPCGIVQRFKEDWLMLYSPYKRATDTAMLINAHLKLKSEQCPLIYEQGVATSDYSLAQNKHSHTNEAYDWNQWWYKEGTMESYADTYQRAVNFYLLLKSGYYKQSNLIIVSHSTFLKILLGVIEKSPIDEILTKYDIDNCQVIKVSI